MGIGYGDRPTALEPIRLDQVQFEFEQVEQFSHQFFVKVNESGAGLFEWT